MENFADKETYMKNLGVNEIRDMFRDFFVSKDHYPGGSSSLIPRNDKSLLIITEEEDDHMPEVHQNE